MIPVLKRGQDRHVVGLEHVKTWREDICELPFMHKYRRLSFADRQFGTVFDLMAFALKTPDDGVAAIVCPFDDVNGFIFVKFQ